MEKDHALAATETPQGTSTRTRVIRALLRAGTRHLNPLMLSLAGRRRMPMLAVIHHRGRRSGRSYATPLAARPTIDGFVIPLTFGVQADWFRNVQAEGGCIIQWKGVNHPVIDPEIVDWPTVRTTFSLVERLLMPIMGIEQCVRLRHAPTSEHVLQT